MDIARMVGRPLVALALLAAPSVASAQISVGLNIAIAPPVLPVFVQPPLPAPGYIWAPGYWAYGPDGYYWVPGTWVLPPQVGFLWTPGYWGYANGVYVYHAGYWGPHIGFYGGVNYGFGYTGVGYQGGHWEGGVFAYNSAASNLGSVQVTNVYNKTVINNTTVNRVSFNGGAGTMAQPSPQEQAAAREQHVAPTSAQTAHQQAASTNREFLASVNHGTPSVAATAKPGEFSGHGVVRAQGQGNPAAGGAGTSTAHPFDARKNIGPANGTPGGAPAGGPSQAATNAKLPGRDGAHPPRPAGGQPNPATTGTVAGQPHPMGGQPHVAGGQPHPRPHPQEPHGEKRGNTHE